MSIAQHQQAIRSAAADPHNEAPTPWRALRAYSEIAAIVDANGFTVALCRKEDAERIVAAVNGAEGTT